MQLRLSLFDNIRRQNAEEAAVVGQLWGGVVCRGEGREDVEWAVEPWKREVPVTVSREGPGGRSRHVLPPITGR